MRHIALAALAFLLAGAASAQARDCQYESGEARWSIKTSIPNQPQDPVAVDLASLIALDNADLDGTNIENSRWQGPAVAQDSDGHDVTLHEGDLITVTGFLYRARCQKDGDYHMEIGAKARRSNARCLIVEVPDPDQIEAVGLKRQVSKARDVLESEDASVFASHATEEPLKITVTGQLFLDETHTRKGDPGGGRGTLLSSGKHCASNLWELHPVTVITNAD